MIRKPPGPTARARAKKRRKQLNAEAAIKAQVRLRDGAICRCCGIRRAESVHEIVPKSLGGKVSLENSLHLCGSGTTGCHGFAQRHEIVIEPLYFTAIGARANAENKLIFTARTLPAQRWLMAEQRSERIA